MSLGDAGAEAEIEPLKHSSLSSKFLFGVCGYIILSAVVCFAYSKHIRDGDTNKSCDYVISQFERQTACPEVIVAGSSLIRKPLWWSDYKAIRTKSFYDHYYGCAGLADACAKLGYKPDRVSNLALDGAMVSDVYLIASKLIRSGKMPKVFVYGIAPRDFSDSLLKQEYRTPIFERLIGTIDLIFGSRLISIPLSERIELVVDRICPLYGERASIQTQISSALTNLISPLAPQQEDICDRKADADLEPETSDFAKSRRIAWQRSIKEYRQRYATFNQSQFKKQETYLFRMLDLLQRSGASVVLINMPLTEENFKLMPNGLYDAYLQTLAKASTKPNVLLSNLQSTFVPREFYDDCVHLNGWGGDFLLQKMVESISKVSASRKTEIALSQALN
jgi:hypothetical protein